MEELSKLFNFLNNNEKKNFSRIINKLLNQCFIIKSNKSDKEDFFFIVQNIKLINLYLSAIDYECIIDSSNGFVSIESKEGYNKLSFNKMQTVFLLILRSLYYRKHKESLNEDIIVTLETINDDINKTQIYNKDLTITEFKDTLNKLKKVKIIDYNNSNLSMESYIIILPSIIKVVDLTKVGSIDEALNKYVKDEGLDEEDNEDQTD